HVHTNFARVPAWDAVLAFSPELAEAHLFPAIAPLHPTSRALTAEVVGNDHVAVATNARLHLSELAEAETRPEAWRTARSARLHRARLLRSYISQPFFITEPFSGRGGGGIAGRRAPPGCAGPPSRGPHPLDPPPPYLGG